MIEAPITTHTVTPTGEVMAYPALATSHTDVTHATPLTRAGLTPATPIALHRKHSQEKPNHTQDHQPPINPTIP